MEKQSQTPEQSERVYKFVRKVNSEDPDSKETAILEVPESELTRQQMAMLAHELASIYNNYPPLAQEMFLKWIDMLTKQDNNNVDMGHSVDTIQQVREGGINQGGLIIKPNFNL